MKLLTTFLVVAICTFYACKPKTNNTDSKNVKEEKSLIAHVELSYPLDESLKKQGTRIFIKKCAKCHTMDTVQFKAPAFTGVTERRSPEWIMNMIINVDEMLKNDPVAAELLRKHKEEMPDQELTVDQARAVLEFLRFNDQAQEEETNQAAEM